MLCCASAGFGLSRPPLHPTDRPAAHRPPTTDLRPKRLAACPPSAKLPKAAETTLRGPNARRSIAFFGRVERHSARSSGGGRSHRSSGGYNYGVVELKVPTTSIRYRLRHEWKWRCRFSTCATMRHSSIPLPQNRYLNFATGSDLKPMFSPRCSSLLPPSYLLSPSTHSIPALNQTRCCIDASVNLLQIAVSPHVLSTSPMRRTVILSRHRSLTYLQE